MIAVLLMSSANQQIPCSAWLCAVIEKQFLYGYLESFHGQYLARTLDPFLYLLPTPFVSNGVNVIMTVPHHTFGLPRKVIQVGTVGGCDDALLGKDLDVVGNLVVRIPVELERNSPLCLVRVFKGDEYLADELHISGTQLLIIQKKFHNNYKRQKEFCISQYLLTFIEFVIELIVIIK